LVVKDCSYRLKLRFKFLPMVIS